MKKYLGFLMGLVILAGILVSQAVSQQEQPQAGPQQVQTQPPTQAIPPKMLPNDKMRDPAQFHQRKGEQIREGLNATDEQWKAIEPKLTKVQSLKMQQRRDMMMATSGRRTPPKGGVETQSLVTTKTVELQKVLDDKESKPEAVKAALQALRDAREKSRKEMTDAQKELAGACTERQQAYLVLIGILE